MDMKARFFGFLAALAAFNLSTTSATAAEIRLDASSGAILEGTINPGDFERLKNYDFNHVDTIYLASPGGNLGEALKIGHLIRMLKLGTVVPENMPAVYPREKRAFEHGLKDIKANYMCASACFFVFIAGIHRESDYPLAESAILGIHRPYFSESDLRAMSSNQSMATARQTRTIVESYLREMGVPQKYADQMFSVPKDGIRWISQSEFEADFDGFIPELKDWIDARCDKRTDVEKAVYEKLKDTSHNQLTAAEKIIMESIEKKYMDQLKCEDENRRELAKCAYEEAQRAGTVTRQREWETNAKIAASLNGHSFDDDCRTGR
jgi:hypothetical protein